MKNITNRSTNKQVNSYFRNNRGNSHVSVSTGTNERQRNTKHCETCGGTVVWEQSVEQSMVQSQVNSDDIKDWPICRDCMIEHCIGTNCLGCSYGVYINCMFMEMKKQQMLLH